MATAQARRWARPGAARSVRWRREQCYRRGLDGNGPRTGRRRHALGWRGWSSSRRRTQREGPPRGRTGHLPGSVRTGRTDTALWVRDGGRLRRDHGGQDDRDRRGGGSLARIWPSRGRVGACARTLPLLLFLLLLLCYWLRLYTWWLPTRCPIACPMPCPSRWGIHPGFSVAEHRALAGLPERARSPRPVSGQPVPAKGVHTAT